MAFGLQSQEAEFATTAKNGYSQELALEFLADPDKLAVNINGIMDSVWEWKTFSNENYASYKLLALRIEQVVMDPPPKSKSWKPSNKLYLSRCRSTTQDLLFSLRKRSRTRGNPCVHENTG